MHFSFDGYNRYEKPVLTLAKQNFTQLAVIQAQELRASIRFNALSELSFYVNKTKKTEHYYSDIRKKRLINVQGFGWFMITKVEETTESCYSRKKVECKSYEAILASRAANIPAGTYKLWDESDVASDEPVSLLGIIARNNISWNVGTVSASLLEKWRTFEMPDTTIYQFLTEDIEQAFECVVTFDVLDKDDLTINVFDLEDAIHDTTIVIDDHNLLKSVEIADTDDDIVTQLSVYGSGDFSIAAVNPLGTPNIPRYDYYKDDMSPSLWARVKEWQDKITWHLENVEDSDSYGYKLVRLKTLNEDLLGLQADLANYQAILDSGKGVLDSFTPYNLKDASPNAFDSIKAWVSDSANKLMIKQWIDNAVDPTTQTPVYPAIDFFTNPSGMHPQIASYIAMITDDIDKSIVQALTNIEACNIVISMQNELVTGKQNEIASMRDSLDSINSDLKPSEWFSTEQLKELDKYDTIKPYSNEYYVKLDSATAADVQDLAAELYQDGKRVLERMSQPNYTFAMDLVNYLMLKKYSEYANDTRLGCRVHAEIRESDWVYPILLEVEINWDKPDDMTFTFGNKYRLDTAAFTIQDLLDDMNRSSTSFSNNISDLIKPARNNTVSVVNDLMKSAWDASLRAVINSVNQDILIDGHGILCRKKGDGTPDGFSSEQMKLQNGGIYITDDGWKTLKTAIGKMELGKEEKINMYGINAEALLGKFVITEYATIANEAGSFRFNDDGFISMNDSVEANATSRIVINPGTKTGYAFEISKREVGDFEKDEHGMPTNIPKWTPQITADADDGSVILSGSLTAVAGWANADNSLTGRTNPEGGGFYARIGSDTAPTQNGLAFAAGNVSGSTFTPNFSVTYGGKMTAQDAVVKGVVKLLGHSIKMRNPDASTYTEILPSSIYMESGMIGFSNTTDPTWSGDSWGDFYGHIGFIPSANKLEIRLNHTGSGFSGSTEMAKIGLAIGNADRLWMDKNGTHVVGALYLDNL